MKKIKLILLGAVIGLLLGLWFGVNIGRDEPVFNNPFDTGSLKTKIKETGESIMQKSGEAIESSGKAIKDSIKK